GISRALPPLRRTDDDRCQRCRPDAAPTRGRCLHARPASYRRALRGLIIMAASRLARDVFGRLADGQAVERVVLHGMHGFEAHVITYGARLQALVVPDVEGRCEDVTLGHDDLAGHVATRKFFGATVGRYANRIANARFVLDGAEVLLAANNGPHALHGGL